MALDTKQQAWALSRELEMAGWGSTLLDDNAARYLNAVEAKLGIKIPPAVRDNIINWAINDDGLRARFDGMVDRLNVQTPDAAAKALAETQKLLDETALRSIFGDRAKELVAAINQPRAFGDNAADRIAESVSRADFEAALHSMQQSFETQGLRFTTKTMADFVGTVHAEPNGVSHSAETVHNGTLVETVRNAELPLPNGYANACMRRCRR